MPLFRTFAIPFIFILCQTFAWSQNYPASQDYRIQIANLTQDVRRLSQQVGQLQLRLEQLERENQTLRTSQISNQSLDAQLDALNLKVTSNINALKKEFAEADELQKQAIIREVSKQMTVLAEQTKKALDALGKVVGFEASTTPNIQFDNSFPKNGIAYTVKPGDTLSGIARKHNSTVRDIQNANKIADPQELKAGETIFVPQKQ